MAEGIAGIFLNANGGLHPLTWVVAILVAAFSIMFVFILVWFIIPAKNSPARHFIKAKREKKPVFFLDAGKFFKGVVCDHKVGEEKAQVFRHGQDIIKGGEGMKYCEGVLMGIGEDFRSLTANVAIIDLMEMIEAKGWDSNTVSEKLKKLESQLKDDLGLKDELKARTDKHHKDLAEINAKFDARRDELVAAFAVPPEPPAPPEEGPQ